MRNYGIGLYLLMLLGAAGCSSKPAIEEGKVRITSTADLGKAVGVTK